MTRQAFLIIALLVTFNFTWAQETFEGKITYKMDAGGNAMVEAFLPDAQEYFFKGENVLIKISGGLAAGMIGDMLMKGKEGVGYMIKHSEKTMYKMEAKDDVEFEPEVTKTDETAVILGYKCRKYKVVTEAKEAKLVFSLWTTEDINIKKAGKGAIPGSSGSMFVESVPGFPLKIESSIMGMSVNSVATVVEKLELSDEMFSIPPDYKVKPFDSKMLMGF